MEKRLLALAVGLPLAHVVAGNSGATYSPFHFPQVNNDSSPQRGGGQHLFNMTYRPLDDLDHNGLDPGVEGEGRRSFNVADTSWSWVGECRSNSSDKWGVTWPVCSTRFTSLVVMVVVTVLLAVITLWTILGNVLVLCALYKYRVLRTMSNCLIGNLAVSDLLLAITVLPISAANDLLGYWVFGSTMCTIWLCIDVLYCTASIWGLCTIAFDRYTATVYPMWYHDKRSPKKALAYMVFVWLFSIVISLAPFIGWRDMIPKFYMHDQEINRYMCILFSSQSYVIYSAMGSFILPLCLMTFLYVQIFVVLHRQADQLKNTPGISRELSSRVDTDLPTFLMHDAHRVLSRDFTASSFMMENTAVDRDRGEREEGEEEEEENGEGDNNVTVSPSGPGVVSHDTEPTDQGPVSPSHSPEKACHDPLLDQRSSSLDSVLQTFNQDAPALSFPHRNLLTVNSCDVPPNFAMKKSRSAAFHFEDKSDRETHPNSHPSPPQVSLRSHSITNLNTEQPKDLENGHSGKPFFNPQRLSSLWTSRSKRNESRSYTMNVSMRRRFQLREQRATKRMLLIMACFFVCWVPFTLMYMLRSLCPRCPHLDDHLTAFIIWLGYVNSSLNPLLYTLFNDDFRKAFKKLLGLYYPRRSDSLEQ